VSCALTRIRCGLPITSTMPSVLAAMLSLMKRLTDDECPLVAVAELVVAESVILKLESRRRAIRNEGPPTKEDAQASTNPTPLWLWKSWKGTSPSPHVSSGARLQ
jgi:hypothetical protein